MQEVIKRILPVGIALFPIGILFGLLAAQVNWHPLEVCLMSLLGFTGSGQFAFLGFVSKGMENFSLFTVFLIILSINLRYIPMSLSATQPLQASPLSKLFLAHWLADESYASEKVNDTVLNRVIIRGVILISWVISTSLGVMLDSLLPDGVRDALSGVSFPVSAILAALSFIHINEYIVQNGNARAKRGLSMLLCLAVILLLKAVLGLVYFWIPSIIVSYIILISLRGKEYYE
jgi:predicted branched-subunit amino acid permease